MYCYEIKINHGNYIEIVHTKSLICPLLYQFCLHEMYHVKTWDNVVDVTEISKREYECFIKNGFYHIQKYDECLCGEFSDDDYKKCILPLYNMGCVIVD